ncbi:hypothetical protein LIER_32681 [Lithospermum erythrorhizon]|uniref:Uncharacterized protein n=1 Tax=Lithospermum erythrorhizon TaxID=34254 RepID=A0AAV3RWB1_LITER
MTTHLAHLHTVLTLLREHRLFAQPSKYTFGQANIEYLGHIISARGVTADPSKIEAMLSWLKPNNLKSLRGFLDAFDWTDESSEAFAKLKSAMSSTPVLALPNFQLPFTIETDASSRGYGLSVYEEELLAIILAITKWKHYLMASRFLIKIDQQSLKHLLEQKVTTYVQQKAVSKLLGLDYIIQYKQGKENVVADALFRVQHDTTQFMAIFTVQPSWMQEIIGSYFQDKELQHVIAGIVVKPAEFPQYSYKESILRYK